MLSVADIAAFAESKQFGNYNAVLEWCEQAKIIPAYECPIVYVYKGMGTDYGYPDKLSEIIDAFVEAYGAQDVLR